MKPITSKKNPKVKLVKSLNDKKARKKLGLSFVEGEKVFRELFLMRGNRIQFIMCSEKKYEHIKSLEFVKPVEIFVVSKEILKELSNQSTPDGIIAVFRVPTMTIEYLTGEENFVVLDEITDPGNMGTIIRTGIAMGIDLFSTINCTDPYSPKAIQSSMGAIFSATIFDTSACELKKIETTFIKTDMKGEDISKAKLPKNFAIVLGNEHNGVSEKMSEICDMSVAIPMEEGAESLNVAVAAGIVMYEIKRGGDCE